MNCKLDGASDLFVAVYFTWSRACVSLDNPHFGDCGCDFLDMLRV